MNTVTEVWWEGDDLHVIDERERHRVFMNCYPIGDPDGQLSAEPTAITLTINFLDSSK